MGPSTAVSAPATVESILSWLRRMEVRLDAAEHRLSMASTSPPWYWQNYDDFYVNNPQSLPFNFPESDYPRIPPPPQYVSPSPPTPQWPQPLHASDGSATTDSDIDISSDSSSDYGSSAKSKSESISIPLKVEHFKSDGKLMKSINFAATASSEGIMIERLTAKEGDNVIGDRPFGPEVEMQPFLREYLEMIGLEQHTGGYLELESRPHTLTLQYNTSVITSATSCQLLEIIGCVFDPGRDISLWFSRCFSSPWCVLFVAT